MEIANHTTTVTFFVLLGFSYNPPVQIFLFLVFFCIYAATLMGNMMIIVVIRGNSHLYSPMYFFLSHLAFLDICFSSVTVPKLLMIFCASQVISYHGCLTQTFFFLLTGSAEAYILAVMAYDRYAAICKPLHYVLIMNRVFCRWLVVGAWTISFVYAMVNILPILKLVFCGSNIINHFSCEFPTVLALSCTETSPNIMAFLITFGAVATSSLLVILVSYIHIISTILKIHSGEAKRKTFSTCSSHIIVVVLYYGSGCFRYMRPNSASSMVVDNLFSIQYSIFTPILNPIIYSLKTREVKEAIKKLMGCKASTSHVM
ncbi:olfactory receptor 8H3-like [Elgaria multicarinata webbii]|uniref:olfactory receptor 8H3-like n=1 Tax=Elgaria multicarinata webbii TaxID=159646 RepID=UPI002FCCD15D